MIFYGVFLIADAKLSMGALIACVILSGRALAPLGQISSLLTRFNTAIAGYKRIDILMSEEAKDEKFLSYDHQGLINKGGIEIKNLTCQIEKNIILDNISMTIKPGEKIALVGALGSGKSTLLKCIVGFNSVEQNSILIDGYDINSISPDIIRKNIGYSPQAIQLFAGSIYDNVGMGKDDFTENDIERACELVRIKNFIGQLPGGYNYVLDERGRNLSGGQKKSFVLARALIKEPKILVLDEPTSSMDSATINNFINNLMSVYQDYTVIIATHSLQDLALIDRVVVLANGKITDDCSKQDFVQKQSVRK